MHCMYKRREISVALSLTFVAQLYKSSPLKFQLIVFTHIQIMWFHSSHTVVCQQTLPAPVTVKLDAKYEP